MVMQLKLQIFQILIIIRLASLNHLLAFHQSMTLMVTE